jgi:hypothetical protein
MANKRHLVAAAVLSASAISSLASASFTASAAGPFNSDGEIGSAGNGSFTYTYTGANTILGGVQFTGTITTGGVGSYLTEARWNVKNLGSGAASAIQPFASGSTWTGSQTTNVNRSLFLWAASGSQFSFEAYESFNDSGIDATWTDVSFAFSAASVTNLGFFEPGDLTFSLSGSSFDTEIALYSAAGTLLATNDDFGGNLWSEVTSTLAAGDYYVIVGGFNSVFNNGAASAGTATGNFALSVNGNSAASGSLAAGDFASFSFTVPTPGALALLGAGLLVGRRRR